MSGITVQCLVEHGEGVDQVVNDGWNPPLSLLIETYWPVYVSPYVPSASEYSYYNEEELTLVKACKTKQKEIIRRYYVHTVAVMLLSRMGLIKVYSVINVRDRRLF